MIIRDSGDDILCVDIEPPVVIAKFVEGKDGLTNAAKARFISEHNGGHELLRVIERYRSEGSLHDIREIPEMIKELDYIARLCKCVKLRDEK
jgi:hypothetical protein